MGSKSVCIVSINVHLGWQSTHWKEGHKSVSDPQNSAQLATVYGEKITYTVVWMFSNRHVMYLSTKETPKHKKTKFAWILSACCIAHAGQYINIDKLSGLNPSRIGTRNDFFLIDSCSMQTCLNILWLQNACSFHIPWVTPMGLKGKHGHTGQKSKVYAGWSVSCFTENPAIWRGSPPNPS